MNCWKKAIKNLSAKHFSLQREHGEIGERRGVGQPSLTPCALCKKIIQLGIFWLAMASLDVAADHQRFYEAQIEPLAGENFSYAYVQCWLPPSAPRVKGILCVVLHPHENRHVRFDSPQPWIELAGQYDCAVMGVSFVEKDGDMVPWSKAAKGSGRALLAAVDELAKKSQAPELSNAPLIVAGICEAGQFAHEFAAFAPERVKAFLSMGGGKHDVTLAQAAAHVPGLLIAAPDRGRFALENMFALFAEGRKHRAPWIFAAEPIKGYDAGESTPLTVSFLEFFLKQMQSTLVIAAQVKLPLNKVVFTVSENAVALMNASDTDCVFPDRSIADKWSRQKQKPDKRTLSFVSKALPLLGHITPLTVTMGTIDLEKEPENCQAVFEVQSEDGIQASDIKILSNPKEFTSKVTQIETGKWQVECQINPQSFPCGAFKIDAPVRFVGNQPMHGGITCTLTGHIIGDIVATPTAINAGLVPRTGKEIRLRIKSRTNHAIEIKEVQSSLPEWVKAKVIANTGASVELACEFSPPPELKSASFSGFLNIKAFSNDGYTVKILFYGTIE
jgi:hypothetical protein